MYVGVGRRSAFKKGTERLDRGGAAASYPDVAWVSPEDKKLGAGFHHVKTRVSLCNNLV